MFSQTSDLREFDLENLKLSFYFAFERYNIFLKKEIQGLPAPWTNDRILRETRFCNLHREHDNVSKTVISFLKMSKDNVNQLVFNAINCRRLNHNYTIVAVSKVLNIQTYTPLSFVKAVEQGYDEQMKHENTATYFDSAYVIAPITGRYYQQLISKLPLYYGTNIEIRISNASYQKQKHAFDIISDKINLKIEKERANLKICLFGIANLDIIENHLDAICNSKNSMSLFKELEKISGIGEFIAGQIAVDIGYVRKDLFDENELAPAGPGCKRGLNLLYKQEVKQSANLKIVQDLLKNIHSKQDVIWKTFNYEKPIFGTMSLMTIENLMCETSKYISEYNKQQDSTGKNISASIAYRNNGIGDGTKIDKKQKRPMNRKKYHKRVCTRVINGENGKKSLIMDYGRE
jgi:hypothetical protein